jgi:hypothetical protein
METIDIGLSDLEPISINLDGLSSSGGGSSNFGPGIELLMNDKKRNTNNSVNIDLGELDNLENELNNLSGVSSSSSSSGTTKTINNVGSSGNSGGIAGFASNLFGFNLGGSSGDSSSQSNVKNDSKLGEATKESEGKTKTWDGFSKMNDIPSDKSSHAPSNLSEREKRRKKKMMIKKLEEWYDKGLIKSSVHFNSDSSYEEIEDEYETALDDKRKKDSIKLQGWWFMTFINSIEYANSAFNPFDINLDGWGEQISEDIDSYEEIFSELHDKYKGGKLSPELSLLLRIGFSAAVVNFTNKALSSATPGFNDVIKQSPELMRMFTNATVSSMSQQSPGFAFASNMMNKPDDINTSFGPPPKPVETKNQPPPQRPSMTFTQNPGNRQDINAARGTMFREQGVGLNSYSDVNNSNSIKTPVPPQMPSTFQQMPLPQPQQIPLSFQEPPLPQSRPEMRGPQNVDINNILAGLKPKASFQPPTLETMEPATNYREDDSMISISSLKDLQNSSVPKKGRRKNTSDKNRVSLDI